MGAGESKGCSCLGRTNGPFIGPCDFCKVGPSRLYKYLPSKNIEEIHYSYICDECKIKYSDHFGDITKVE